MVTWIGVPLIRLVMRLTLPQADMEANIVPIEKVLFFVLTYLRVVKQEDRRCPVGAGQKLLWPYCARRRDRVVMPNTFRPDWQSRV